MFEKLEAIKKKNIYFADITEAKEESDKGVSKKKDIFGQKNQMKEKFIQQQRMIWQFQERQQ